MSPKSDIAAPKHPPRATLADIAKEAHVSNATVSLVLNANGVENKRVSPETARRTLEVARRLGYTPNIQARSLAGKSSRLLGVIVDTKAPASRYEILSAISTRAAELNYRVMISEIHDSVRNLADYYRELLQYGADGVICLAHDYPRQRQAFKARFRHCADMVVQNPYPGIGIAGLRIDIEPALRAGFEHFLARGRKRIMAQLPDIPVWDVEQRAEMHGKLCGAFGLPTRLQRVSMPSVASAIQPQAAEFVRDVVVAQKIDALFAVNDLYASWFIAEAAKVGVRVPEDVAVIGLDNCEYAGAMTPALASIDLQNTRQGEKLVDLLLGKIGAREDGDVGEVAAELILRQSAG